MGKMGFGPLHLSFTGKTAVILVMKKEEAGGRSQRPPVIQREVAEDQATAPLELRKETLRLTRLESGLGNGRPLEVERIIQKKSNISLNNHTGEL